MRICPRCSFEATDDSKICRACGSILEDVEVSDPQQSEMAQDAVQDCASGRMEVPASPVPIDEPTDLQDAISHRWTCPTCGEHIERDFNVCWNCGTAEDGKKDPGFVKVEDEDDTESPGFSEAKDEVATKNAEFVKAQVVTECPFARLSSERQPVRSDPRSSTVDNIVFVGFNSRIAALDRNTGRILWKWKSPVGRGYVSLLLLDDRQLIASVEGYTYCLDPLTGRQHWFNELPGFGSGVTSIVALDKHNPHDQLVAAAAAKAAADAAND